MKHHKVDDRFISAIVNQIKGFDYSILHGNLAISAWDIHQHLKHNPRNDVNDFEKIISEVEAKDRKRAKERGEDNKYFPYSDTLFPQNELKRLPQGMAERAARGDNPLKDFANLDDSSIIVHEWTVHPGEDIFDIFKIRSKKAICGNGGPYWKYKNGELTQDALPQSIAIAIMKNEFSVDTFWTHFTAYIGVLFVKSSTYLEYYCRNEQ